MTWLKSIAILCVTVILSACQFHAQHRQLLPASLQTLYLKSSAPYSQFTRALRAQLVRAGAVLVTNPEPTQLVLHILSEERGQLATTVGAAQQSREYALTYTVHFELMTHSGRVILANQTAFEYRNIVLQANQVLGATTQQEDLYRNMQSEVIKQIIDRLGAPATTQAIASALSASTTHLSS